MANREHAGDESRMTKWDRRSERRQKREYSQVKHAIMGIPRGLTKTLKKVLNSGNGSAWQNNKLR